MRIEMNIKKKFRSHLNVYRDLRAGAGYSLPAALLHYVQWRIYCKTRPEEFSDMIMYDFIAFKHPEIYKTMFTTKDNAALLELVNDPTEIHMLREKHLLLEKLKNGIDRRFLYVPAHTEEEFIAFIRESDAKKYVMKVDNSAGGRGMSVLEIKDNSYLITDIVKRCPVEHTDFTSLYEQCRSENILIEEYITQHDEISKIFGGCVNTVNIYTARLADGHTETLCEPYIVFGMADSVITNGNGTVEVIINNDGSLREYGFARDRNLPYPYIEKVTSHPDSKCSFAGFKIPFWEEAVELVIKSAEQITELTYIRWDVAITPTGPVIVEGNGMPASFVLEQTYSLEARGMGIKREYAELLKALEFSRKLRPEYIEKINRSVEGNLQKTDIQDCDTVIVLGSTRCISRIQAAFDAFKENDKIRYIVCGGNFTNQTVDPNDIKSEKLTEAEFMRRFLLERNIPESRIISDNSSRNTVENLRIADNIIKKVGASKIAIVSAWFHGERIVNLLTDTDYLHIGYDKLRFVPAYGDQTRPDNWHKTLYGIRTIYHEAQYITEDEK